MNGGRGDGTITDMAKMLEPTTTEVFMLINYFNALDIVYDAADALSDQLTAAFEKAPAPDGTNRKDNPFNIKRAVHEMIPYAIDLCDINKGVTHDSSVRWIHLKMLVAAFMGSDSLMDSTLYGGDMSFMSKIRNCYYRDGRYAYDSMEYQKLISLEMMLYPNCSYMYKYSDGRVLNLFDDSKMNCGSIISLHFKLLCGDLTPAFGDTQINNNEPIKQSRLESKAPYSPLWEAVYTRTHNENLKRMIAVALSGYTPEELESERVKSVESLDNLDSASINETMLLLACAPDSGIYKLKSEDAGVPESVLLEDSQTSILRSGTSLENTKHLIMYGQPSAPHDHGDKLGLWLGAYGYHLLAGGGGYPYTWADSKWHEWEQSSGACMVVIIDGKSQCRSYSSLKAHIDGSRVKLSSMENSGAYPGCFYGRTAALITAPDGENAFAADFAYADGGSFYDYNTSGIGLDFKNIRFSGIKKREKLSGTLAGKDVTLYSAPDYAWMKADAEANIDEEHRAEWNFRHASEVGLAVSEISVPNDASEEKLIRAYGEMGGFERGKSPWVPYVMHRKTTKAKNEKCVFAHILEPYKGSRFISRVKPLQLINASFNKNTPCFAPVGCEVEYKSGEYKDIVISCHDSSCKASFSDISGTEYTTDALFALFRYKSGRLVYAEAYGYTIARAGDFITPEHENPYYNGTITEVDYTSGHIEIEIAGEMPEASLLSGRVAVISSDDYEKPSLYYMNEIKSGGNRISFVSDMPFALQDTSWERGEKSRGMGGKTKIRDGESEYYADIKPGDAFRCETGGVLIG
ncbi:hypothetical protein SDC9_84095 [bioreactor metagenome]|uniref:Uncharacterized protein n=1 Tax=bioreactor metagenome TaxID=1076179 RepID=A0A644ZB13_9ZZZZ